MSKIGNAFKNGKAFIGFLTAGDPSLDKTYEYIMTMEKAGADLIEIGIPFSDPIAEGIVIQEADLRALKAGTRIDDVFALVERVRKETQIPLVFLTYLNPVFHYGAEKFFDIKCRAAGLHPSAVVVVATVRALKHHGGVAVKDLNEENLDALKKGLPNLLQHVANIKDVYHLPCVVAINAFPTDTKAELDLVEAECKKLGVNAVLSEVWAKGGEGGIALAEEVVKLCEEPNDFSYAYDTNDSIEDKLDAIAKKIYHADGVDLTADARQQMEQLEALGFSNLPICMAKTQYSFSDDASLLGAPKGFRITVRNIKVSSGAGFIVALTGDIMTMPGLPKVPAAENIDVDETGKITGLF